MTDEQVKKGLECCSNTRVDNGLCYECPYVYEGCPLLYKDALALINRLEGEKEQIRKGTATEIFDILEKLEEKGRVILPVGFLFTGRGAYGVEV